MSYTSVTSSTSTFAPFLPTSQPHSQCGSGRLEDVKILVSHYVQPPEETDANGRTQLHHAVWFNHPAVQQVLLDRSSSSVVNMQDTFGNTAQFYAVYKDHEDYAKIITQLMRSGANADIPNKQHRTARLVLYSGQHQQHNADVSRLISPDTALAATGTRQIVSLTSTAVLSAARTANTRTVSGGFLSKARVAHILKGDELNRDSAAVFTSLHTYGPNLEFTNPNEPEPAREIGTTSVNISQTSGGKKQGHNISKSLRFDNELYSPGRVEHYSTLHSGRNHPYTHAYTSSVGFHPFNFVFEPEPIPSLPNEQIEDIVVRVSKNPHSTGAHTSPQKRSIGMERNLRELRDFTRAKLSNTKSLLGVLPNSQNALTDKTLSVLSPTTFTKRDFWDTKKQQVDRSVIQTLHKSLHVHSPRESISSPRKPTKPPANNTGFQCRRQKSQTSVPLPSNMDVATASSINNNDHVRKPPLQRKNTNKQNSSLRVEDISPGTTAVETHISQLSLQNQHIYGLVCFLENSSLKLEDIELLLHQLDSTADGKVDIEDYWSALIPRIGCLNALPAQTLSESIDRVFLFLDVNQNGLIDVEDLLVLKDKLGGLLHIDNEWEALKFIDLVKQMYLLGKDQLLDGLQSHDGGAAYIQWKSHALYPPENTVYHSNQEVPVESAPGLNREVFFCLAGGIHESYVAHMNKCKKENKEKLASRPQSSILPKPLVQKMSSLLTTESNAYLSNDHLSVPTTANTSTADLNESSMLRFNQNSYSERTYKSQPIGPRAAELPINKL